MFHENKQDIISSQNEQPEISNEPETTENPPEALYSQDDAQQLIEKGEVWRLAKELKNYQDLNENIAEQLIKENYYDQVVDNLKAFSNLSLDFAQKLIKGNNGVRVVDNLESFSPETHNDIAHQLLEEGYGLYLLENSEKFSKIDFSEADYETIANPIIKSGDYGLIDELGKNIDKFPRSLHKKIAQQLIDKDHGWVVADNLEKFSGLNHQDHQEIAQKLINLKWGSSLIENVEKFSNINYNEIVHQLINLKDKYDETPYWKNRYEATIYSLANNLGKLSGLDKDIAITLIHAGGYHRLQVANNLQAFSPADHEAIILELINYPYSEEVKNALKNSVGKIPQLSETTAKQLANSRYRDILKY